MYKKDFCDYQRKIFLPKVEGSTINLPNNHKFDWNIEARLVQAKEKGRLRGRPWNTFAENCSNNERNGRAFKARPPLCRTRFQQDAIFLILLAARRRSRINLWLGGSGDETEPLIARQESPDYLKAGPFCDVRPVHWLIIVIDQPVTSHGAFNAPWCRHDTRTLD